MHFSVLHVGVKNKINSTLVESDNDSQMVSIFRAETKSITHQGMVMTLTWF